MINTDVIEKMIKEAKEILKAYKKTPLNKIPEDDRERFNLAWVTLQAALGVTKFKAWLKEDI